MSSDLDSKRPPVGQTFIDPAIVETMKRLATGQTDEALNSRFGISYNTWRKLVAGQPVRRSLAERVTCRVSQMTQCADRPSA
ncbi:hypothetical protein U5A82_04505 [Sphingobium sp. CR2-8]|uniref:hypothetical protein n=1 Tax=Sphingobium sp. CR2-8 TaxID=1306534 RepID=UPI002DBB3225|nr:hypothetical protein [Sphingobium sp. CR2-8]MEC3909754.1 hypothetical protein [Sphingobium sp. CR2-8]